MAEGHVDDDGIILGHDHHGGCDDDDDGDGDDDGNGRADLASAANGAPSLPGDDDVDQPPPLWSLLSKWSTSSNPSGCYLSTAAGEREDGGGGDEEESSSSAAAAVRGLRTSVPLEPGDDVLTLPWGRVLGMRAACNLLAAEHDAGRGVLILADDSDSRGRNGKSETDGAEALRWMVETVRSACGDGSIRRGSGEEARRRDSDSDSDSDDSLENDGVDRKDSVPSPSSADSFSHVLWSAVMACALLSAVVERHSRPRGNCSPRSSSSERWGPYVASLPLPPPSPDGRSGEVESALGGQFAEETRRDDDDDDDGDKCSVPGSERLRHVLLWSEAELRATGDDELVRTVEADRDRLRRVWEALFVVQEGGGVPPAVEWESWLWAHAILRSRAVGMPEAPLGVTTYLLKSPKADTTPGGGRGISKNDGEKKKDGRILLQGQGVLLPLVDMINHRRSSSSPRRDGESPRSTTDPGLSSPADLAPRRQAANARLALRPGGVAVVVVATTNPVRAHSELFFDYHPTATMRNIFRGYGFVDDSSSSSSSSSTSGRVRQTYRPRGRPRVGLDVLCSSRSARASKKVGLGGKMTATTTMATEGMIRAVGVRPDARTGGVSITVCDGEVAWGSDDDDDDSTTRMSSSEKNSPVVSDGGRDDDDDGEEEEELDRLPCAGARAMRSRPWPEPISLLEGGDEGGDEGGGGGLTASPLDEGQLCGAAAECARVVLKSIESHGAGDFSRTSTTTDGNDRGNIKLAEEYRAANAALIRRCLHDLETLAALFGGGN